MTGNMTMAEQQDHYEQASRIAAARAAALRLEQIVVEARTVVVEARKEAIRIVSDARRRSAGPGTDERALREAYEKGLARGRAEALAAMRCAAASVDVYADGRLVGRGQPVLIDGRAGVRIVELTRPDGRLPWMQAPASVQERVAG